MTPVQRNDLCIEWECTSAADQHQLIEEYQKTHDESQEWENWEEFVVERLRMKEFWATVGLA